ncbi:MAG: DUF58 domain-containing protein [Alphaproteobacteria bacterium]
MSIINNILKLRHEAEGQISDLPALMMRAQNIATNVVHGAHPQRISGTGEKFWQFREYAPSDRPQDIDWRQSAKGDDVLVRQKEWHTTQKTYLWCAGGASMNFRSSKTIMTKQDCAMVLTLSLALLLRDGEEHIGIFGNLNTGRSEERIEKIGSYLLARHYEGENLPKMAQFDLPRQASFIAVGDFISSKTDIKQVISHISNKTNNGTIVQIFDPAELDLPYSGRVRFEGENLSAMVDNVASIREAYKSRVNGNIDFIKTLCHDYGWHYILHRTDHDISDTLKDILAMSDFDGSAV